MQQVAEQSLRGATTTWLRGAATRCVEGLDAELARRSHRYVVGPPHTGDLLKRLRRLSVPGITADHRALSATVRLRIELQRVTTPWGFSFHPRGWHPYVATFDHWDRQRSISLDDTPLHRLYERLQPTTVQELLLDTHHTDVAPLSDWPVSTGLLNVWTLTPSRVERALLAAATAPKRHRQFVGPTAPERIAEDLHRLLDLRRSIALRGYNPVAFRVRPISGYVLVHDDDYRFVCRHGNHRLAVMASLGYQEVTVELAPRAAPIVNSHELEWWTTRRGGLYDDAVAEMLFRKMFTEDGKAKARLIGMMG